MPAIKVTKDYFSSSRNLYGNKGLGAVVRALAIDNARIKIENAGVPDITDNSTGTASAAGFVDLVVPTAAFDATSAGGAQRAAFNTAIGKFEDAGRVLANSMNNVRARLGLPYVGVASGAQAAANTVPAQDKTVASATGTSALDYATGREKMNQAKQNLRRLVWGFGEVMRAVGETPPNAALTGSQPTGLDLVAIADAAASSTGASAISKTVVDAFLTALANNVATLVAKWNDVMFQTGLTDLTDSSGGTASDTIASLGTITPYTTAGTDLSPKAGFDAELAKHRNNFADLTARANGLRRRYGLPLLVDSSAGTANTTVEAVLVDLTAVNGSGNTGLAAASALTTWNAVKANVATLVRNVNDLADEFGLVPITDNSGGTADTTAPITIVAMPDTAAGVAGTANSGVADTEVDANLVALRNAFASIAAKLNAMTGADSPTKALGVVAG